MANVYCCIDIEASGPVPALFDIVSLGGVAVVERDGRHRLADAPSFYVEFQPQGGRHEPEAMRVHGLTADHLQREGVPLADGLGRLVAWTEGLASPGERRVFVGHNAPFDWSFVSYAFAAVGLKNPFGWKALDTKALAMGVLGLDWFDTNKETLERLLPDLGPQDEALVHRADYDAAYQARILCGLLDHPRRRTGPA